MNAKIPKINFPYFNGEDPRERLRKARKYFQMHQVPDDLKVGIAKMYLKGKADIWFHGFINSHPNTDEVIEVFSKLRQKETIAE